MEEGTSGQPAELSHFTAPCLSLVGNAGPEFNGWRSFEIEKEFASTKRLQIGVAKFAQVGTRKFRGSRRSN